MHCGESFFFSWIQLSPHSAPSGSKRSCDITIYSDRPARNIIDWIRLAARQYSLRISSSSKSNEHYEISNSGRKFLQLLAEIEDDLRAEGDDKDDITS